MKIAILGSGGREHAMAYKISKSPKLKKLYCIPGNAGTSFIAENVKGILSSHGGEILKGYFFQLIQKNDIIAITLYLKNVSIYICI